jgi:hypothetical protein
MSNFSRKKGITNSMKAKLIGIVKSRLALSTVVITLIILVISVSLASLVAYYAINVTGTRSQEELLQLSNQHLWYNAATISSQGAIMVVNTGGRDVVIDKIAVRNDECNWTSVYYCVTANSVSSDFKFCDALLNNMQISMDHSNYTFRQATNDLTLPSGQLMMLYFDDPPGININSVGLLSPITVFTAQATYYKETNVQALLY